MVLCGALIVGAAVALFPMLWMISASLMPTGEASTYPPRVLPSHVTFEHYQALFTRLINSYWGVIIPGLASIFGIFLIRQYAQAIPDDMLDAARIDGASEMRIYRSVVLPGIVPILATLAIWTILATVLTIIPVLLVFLFLQRYYIQGVMAGSVKG